VDATQSLPAGLLATSVPTLQPVLAARLTDAVRSQLRQAILSGELAPGSRLSVPELARQLGVSRSPVREAVLGLVAEGLAVEHSRRGAEVVRLHLREVLELYETRSVIEAHLAGLAAERMSTADLAALQGIWGAQGGATVGEPARYRELDGRFHGLIAECSGHTRMTRLLASLMTELKIGQPFMDNSREHLQLSFEEHRAVVVALRSRDGPAASAAMHQHLLGVATRVRARQHPPDQP
jgi:DNA-binding GntR family transcriptional regulator